MFKKIGVVSMKPKAGALWLCKKVASPIGVVMNAVLVLHRHSETTHGGIHG